MAIIVFANKEYEIDPLLTASMAIEHLVNCIPIDLERYPAGLVLIDLDEKEVTPNEFIEDRELLLRSPSIRR